MLRQPPTARRRGYVLYIVLVVVVVLSFVAWQYSDAMSSEAAAATQAHDAEQVKSNAVSGIYHSVAIFTDPYYSDYNLEEDQGLFAGQFVGLGEQPKADTPQYLGDANVRRGGGRFSVYNLSGGTSRFGLEDEGRKLNINALIQGDATGTTLYNALTAMQLPGMTPEIVGAIVDWVDADETEYPAETGGAENDYYTGLTQPYRCKNGPLHTLEELLLVKGVTPELLFGDARNRTPDPSVGSSRGWSEHLTCYGREVNVDQVGLPRVSLNGTDLQALDTALMNLDDMTRELADYILYFRISGSDEKYQTELPSGKVPATVADLRQLVDAAVTNNLPMKKGFGSSVSILDTQIRLRPKAVPGPNGQPIQVIPVVPSPLTTQNLDAAMVVMLLDRCTVSEEYEAVPRINVNTAPKEVLAALKGVVPYTVDPANPNAVPTNVLTDDDITKIESGRPTNGTQPTAAWLVNDGLISAEKFKTIEKYVCGRSGAYRARSVGYYGTPGATQQATVEAVIEVVVQDLDDGYGPVARPRIAYYRDLTELGGSAANLPR